MNFSGRKDNAGRAQVKIIQSTKKIHRRSEGMKVPCPDRALLSLAPAASLIEAPSTSMRGVLARSGSFPPRVSCLYHRR